MCAPSNRARFAGLFFRPGGPKSWPPYNSSPVLPGRFFNRFWFLAHEDPISKLGPIGFEPSLPPGQSRSPPSIQSLRLWSPARAHLPNPVSTIDALFNSRRLAAAVQTGGSKRTLFPRGFACYPGRILIYGSTAQAQGESWRLKPGINFFLHQKPPKLCQDHPLSWRPHLARGAATLSSRPSMTRTLDPTAGNSI